MSSLLTVKQKVFLATALENSWINTSNTYLGIGAVVPWANGSIPNANNSTDSENFVFDNLVALKKLTASDFNLVIPRVDWAANSYYVAYDNQLDMFTYDDYDVGNGTITITSSNNTIVGNNTTFFLDFGVGQYIAYANSATQSYETKEIVAITSNTQMMVNSGPSFTATAIQAFNYSSSFPYFYNSFYVRNSYDQVFKCLDSNSAKEITNQNNTGLPSTVMPQISLGGDLPTNPYIQTSDGYKWKYMYTIPGGLKQKFFTTQWMPVVTDTAVLDSAVHGRIDILRIVNGGTGYNSNVATSNAAIITVTGDGTGANIVAQVDSTGAIVGYQILDGGQGYTYANVTVNQSTSTGNTAILRAIISPEGGHGSNTSLELGATNIMLCPELIFDEGGIVPVGSGLSPNPFQYYQISIIQNPETSANTSNAASGSIYNVTIGIYTGPVKAGSLFQMGDTAYQGLVGAPTFTGTIVNWDNVNNILYLNNIRGTFTPYSQIQGKLGGSATAFNEVPPGIQSYTGDILYVQNRSAVSRSIDQTEQIKIVIEL